MSDLLSVDLGTGTVIGLVARGEENGATLVARAEKEHHPDAVREGRIVDRDRAADTLRSVLERLNEEIDLDTSRVHFAISSRGLHQQAIVEELVNEKPGVFPDNTMERLEARKDPELEEGFFTVDERVLERTVDGVPVESFAGQFGRRARVRWLNHSLPRADLEGRLAVLESAGLMPGSLVLEPVAAVRAAFPREKLKVRLMLLDFGAGTLDATLLSRGQIEGVTSIGGSGDELTEAIEERFGIPFHEAQECKHGLSEQNVYKTENWSGQSIQLEPGEVLSALVPVVRGQLERLRSSCRGWEPEQICLAGGGSQFPFLPRIVSNLFSVDEDSIVNQPPRVRPPLEDPERRINRSSDYTVVGILQSVLSDRVRKVLRFEVNRDSRLRTVRTPPTLKELALEEGIRERNSDIEPVMVVVDGETHTRRPPESARIRYRRNGDPAKGEEIVRSGDRIRILPPEEDVDQPTFHAEEFLPEETLTIRWRKKTFRQRPELVDGQGDLYRGEDQLQDGGRYQVRRSFDYEMLVSRLRAVSEDVPDNPLFRKDGQYVRKELFELGDEVEMEVPVDPEEFALGRLERIDPPDRPLDTPLV